MKLLYSEKKLKKGLIRIRLVINDYNKIESITITGDFFLIPEDALWKLEDELKGIEFNSEEIKKRVVEFFERTGADLVGSEPEEIADAILEAE